jgi:hypothetical protein
MAGYPPPAAAVERVLAVARGDVKAADVGCGVRVARTAGVLRLERAADGAAPEGYVPLR